MGLTEIRTAAKVDLKKAADQQDVLHVRQLHWLRSEHAEDMNKEQMASRWQAPLRDRSPTAIDLHDQSHSRVKSKTAR